MLDEFPALGRLDFFESALAFMAGYGLKSFLIAQSLNQIEKAYGSNNSIWTTATCGSVSRRTTSVLPSACPMRSVPQPSCVP
jgi:type IV secretory pathway TraG/TraD family ATPase VirD4